MTTLGNPLLLGGEGGYQISRSVRLRSSASAYFNRTPSVVGSGQKFTWSGWVKRGSLGSIQLLFSAGTGTGATTAFTFYFNPSDQINIGYAGADWRVTSAVFRDVSSFYHFVLSIDTTQTVESDRIRLYVNGVQTNLTVNGSMTQNTITVVNSITSHKICSGNSAYYVDGYLTEVNFIDGQALTPSSFGETDTITGVWKPKRYAGTYGTNGFYLNFSDNSAATAAAIGKDWSGNGNNWTPNNISVTAGATYDSMLDVPTMSAAASNYATLNPLHTGRSTLTNGNLTASGSTDLPTIIPDSGNWYFEIDGVSKNWTPPAAFPAAAGNYNFGQRPFTNSVTSGYKALNTQNLPDATIKKGNAYFDATTYTGTGAALSVTNAAGFSPDFVWAKGRSVAYAHGLYDSTRGATKKLSSDSTGAEVTDAQGLTAFNSNGFSLGTDAGTNQNAATYVAWQWKESASAGFDIVTYTGTGVARTVAHSLGVTPSMVIVKSRTSGVRNWPVYHKSNAASGTVWLNVTNAFQSLSGIWNSTAPTSSVFSVGTDADTNENGQSYVAYCFAEVAGFSKFGSYVGNGSADGPFVNLGFRPKFVMVKRTDTAGASWIMNDTSRDTYNVTGNDLYANASTAEVNEAPIFDLLSNGFKCRSAGGIQTNASGGTYIYAAFAENPFKNSLAR